MGTQDSPIDSGQDRPPLALIAGPTASGKSDLAVRLALALMQQGRQAVVINADSAQVYADLGVLSARPSDAEMQGVPHRLFGAWDGALACSAADWAEAARAEIAAAHADKAVPILVGGTGLYLRTLLDGIAPVPPIDPEVRLRARQLPLNEARDALLHEDPEAAARRTRMTRPGSSVRWKWCAQPVGRWRPGKSIRWAGLADPSNCTPRFCCRTANGFMIAATGALP